jgi:transcriptional regulator with XRE-family HTH domain
MPKEMTAQVAAFVKGAREVSGLSQEQLAARTGMQPATIGGIECGQAKSVSLATLEKIATNVQFSECRRSITASDIVV